MLKIKHQKITFVVQGPIVKEGDFTTRNTIESIKKNFPKSKIVLSTWEREILPDISVDEIVISKDPGPLTYGKINNESLDAKHPPNNFNRQQVSTINGLKKVQTCFSVKIRSDSYLLNNKLAYAYRKPLFHNKKTIIFKEKIVVPSVYTINPHLDVRCFHISDIFMMGLTEDMLNYWDCIPMSQTDSNYCSLNNIQSPVNIPSRFCPEQHLMINYLYKLGFIREFPENHFTFTKEERKQFEKIISDNIIVRSFEKLGIRNKFSNIPEEHKAICYK